jgi:hypothetical protein
MVTYEIEGHKPEHNLILGMEFSGKDVMITATDNDNRIWYIARFTSDGRLRLAKDISDEIGLVLDEENRITIVD